MPEFSQNVRTKNGSDVCPNYVLRPHGANGTDLSSAIAHYALRVGVGSEG